MNQMRTCGERMLTPQAQQEHLVCNRNNDCLCEIAVEIHNPRIVTVEDE
jgi:hypothetical protein